MPPLVDSVTTKRGSSDVLSPESAVDPLQTLMLLACRTNGLDQYAPRRTMYAIAFKLQTFTILAVIHATGKVLASSVSPECPCVPWRFLTFPILHKGRRRSSR